MNLLPEARSIVVGSLLGDAYLYPNGTLQIEHSLDQASYVWWKYEKLRGIAGKLPTAVQRYDARYSKTYQSLRFYTRAVLKELRFEFYRDRRKVIPARIVEWFDPLALAVWFMDDGGRGARTPKGLVINTSGFSADEQLLLQRALAERFGVSVSIHTVGRGFQLYVKVESFDRFAELISPYLLPQMSYKLPVDPVTTEGKNPEMVAGPRRTVYSHHQTSALAVGLRDEGIV
jgi:sRNA-binding regulator protein Hfq